MQSRPLKAVLGCSFLGSLLLISLVSFSPAEDLPALYRGVRPLGMGGAFLAVSDDHNAFFYNPAGITQREKATFTLFELPIGISKDLFDTYKFFSDNQDDLEDFEDLDIDRQQELVTDVIARITHNRNHITAGFPNINYIGGPSSLVQWGWGVFGIYDVKLKVNRGIIAPNVDMWGSVDAIVIVPVAHKIEYLPLMVPGNLSVGANLKYINRWRIEEKKISILQFEQFDPDLQKGKGVGIDLGALYQLTDKWQFAMAITDFGGTKIDYESVDVDGGVDKPAGSGVITPSWDVGFAYRPDSIPYWPGKRLETKDILTLVVDVNDITDSDEGLFKATFFTKLHMGAELNLFKQLKVRGGFNQGYPTLGLGLSALFLHIDYAFWGEELGRYAGDIPEWNHMISLAVKI